MKRSLQFVGQVGDEPGEVGFVHIAGEGRVIFKDGRVVNYR